MSTKSAAEQARADVQAWWREEGLTLPLSLGERLRETLIARVTPVYERARFALPEGETDLVSYDAWNKMRERAERAKAEVQHITADKKLCDYEIARLVKAKDQALADVARLTRERDEAYEHLNSLCDPDDEETETGETITARDLRAALQLQTRRLKAAEADVARLTAAGLDIMRRFDPARISVDRERDYYRPLWDALVRALAATEPK